jgi:hypothetical protein
LALLALAGACFGQTATTGTAPIAAPAATTLPSYFAETGLSYDYYGKTPASTTGFGVRIGASNAYSVTDIDTPIAQPGSSYATLRTGIEYHMSVAGRWEFIGMGAAGATTNGSTTTSTFSGGAAASYDVGSLLTRGKINLPLVFEFRMVAITAAQVKPTYSLQFRKTFN